MTIIVVRSVIGSSTGSVNRRFFGVASCSVVECAVVVAVAGAGGYWHREHGGLSLTVRSVSIHHRRISSALRA